MSDSEMLIDVAERVRASVPEASSAEEPPAKHLRIARVGAEEFPVNDEPVADEDVLASCEDSFDEEFDFMDPTDWVNLESDEQFWFTEIPDLSDEALQSLDQRADEFEVQRLLRMQVLRHVGTTEDTASYKELSSKFVRSWRKKKKAGRDMVYRRSRLVVA